MTFLFFYQYWFCKWPLLNVENFTGVSIPNKFLGAIILNLTIFELLSTPKVSNSISLYFLPFKVRL